MLTIPASEIKRRGVAALEESLVHGPVHIIKNNRLACVVLSEEDYARLMSKQHATDVLSLWELLDDRPWTGKRTKKDINTQIRQERRSWKDSDSVS